MPRIGLISDTHGWLRPEAVRVLAGVQHVVHAGDIGPESVLRALEAIAPVTAVRGNVDRESWCERLPLTAELEFAGTWLHVRHDLGELAIDPAAGGFDVVVSGHSHRPAVSRANGVLYVNPGSAGPRRFRLPVTVAILRLEQDGPHAEIVPLEIAL